MFVAFLEKLSCHKIIQKYGLYFVNIYNPSNNCALCNFKISQIIQSDDSRHSIIARLPLLDVFKSFCLHYLFTLFLSLYLFFSLDILFPSYKLQLKVSNSRKQFMVSSILPKKMNEKIRLYCYDTSGRIVFVRFLGEWGRP